MEQKDLFLKQLDQFGRALANVLSRFAGGDYSASAASKIEETDQLLTEHLDISLNDLLDLESPNFIDSLSKKYKVEVQNFEKIAEVLVMCAENCKDPKEAYQKAILLYEYVQANTTNYSFERQEKIMQLKNLIIS